MVFTRKKARAGANPEYPQRTHPETNKCELRNPGFTVFTHEQNELFVQKVVQKYWEKEGEDLNYHVLGLKESSTKYDMKTFYSKLDL